MKVKVKLLSHVRLFATPRTVAYQAPAPMGSSSKNPGVGCHFLLQEIFPTQGLNPGLPHCRQMLYRLSHQGSPFLCACWVLSRFSRVCLFVILWTVAPRQGPLSMGFSKQEHWSGLPFPPPGELPDPGIKPTSLMSPASAFGFFTTSATWEALDSPLIHYLA